MRGATQKHEANKLTWTGAKFNKALIRCRAGIFGKWRTIATVKASAGIFIHNTHDCMPETLEYEVVFLKRGGLT